MSSSSQAGGDPWAWLGLLKWSLNHVDGTSDNSDAAVPMSDEDRAFLEKVMKEGIIDENERMKVILREAAEVMEGYKNNNNNNDNDENDDDDEKTANLQDLLQELRDIVEQIDYARAFCSLKGLPFLLGCISSNSSGSTESSSSSSHTTIPESIKVTCLGILATLAQNNPHVQQELLEMGACKTLSDVYFLESSSKTLKAKVMQAMSSIVRNNQVAEEVFCNLPQSPALFMEGLKLDDNHNDNDNNNDDSATLSLQTKTLFFLKALLTSDASTVERVTTFQNSVIYIIDHGAEYYLHAELSSPPISDLREMAISLLDQLLDRQLLLVLSVPGNDDGRKNALVGCAVQRIAQIRALTNAEDKELAQMELEHWEHLLVVLARQG